MSTATRPRVLMFTPQSPYPPHQGTTLRNYHLLSRLAQHADVTLVTFVEPGQPAPMHTPLGDLCACIHACPAPRRKLRERLRTLVFSSRPDLAWRLFDPGLHQAVTHLAATNGFDVLLVEGLEMAPYLETYLAHCRRHTRPRVVMDAHNAEYVLQQRAFQADLSHPLRWHAALYSLMQWFKLRRYEHRILSQVDHVIAVSEVDRHNLQQLGIDVPITVVPNGVDVAYYAQESTPTVSLPPNSLVFTGKMDFRPNVDAVTWFVEHVWPRVLAEVPEAHFYIVGRSPHPRILQYGEMPGVFVTGEVTDVRPYLWGAQVYVAPLRVGGGTRLKLLEAMAAQRAIVSTSLAAEGYPVQPGVHLLLADTPTAFAAAVVDLLRSPALRSRLGEAAYAFVRERYDWDTLFPRFLAAVFGPSVHEDRGPSQATPVRYPDSGPSGLRRRQ